MTRRLFTLPKVLICLIALASVWTGWALANNEASEARMLEDLKYLASDECEGRGIETQGIHKAADYIAKTFAGIGVKPGGVEKSYFQPFNYYFGPGKEKGPSKLTLKGPLGQAIELKQGVDFQVLGLSARGTVSAPIVFAGYGAIAKEINYDDYQGIDVAGKVVLLLRRTPRFRNAAVPFDGPRKEQHAALEMKMGLAESARAAAVMVVNDAGAAPDGDLFMPFEDTARASASIPGFQLRRCVADMIFQSFGETLADVEQAIDRDLKPRSRPILGWTATLEANVERPAIACKNVIGVLEGAGPLASETVVIGAHYDHLGYGGRGSLAKNKNEKAIHYGADDNASGTTAVLELARRFAEQKNRQGRRLVFMAFSAEESGLRGSQYYCNKEPLFHLAETVAMVNLDMVGRSALDPKTQKQKLIVEGIGTAKHFEKMVEELNPGFQLTKRPGSPPYSDNDSFYKKKIPVLFYWTDTHPDYHKPSDTWDKINLTEMRKIVDLAEKTVARLATDAARPEYVQVAIKMTPITVGPGKMPRLGIVPNYDDQAGVVATSVTPEGPAAKAGIKAGDIIVEIAGKAVPNLNTYMAVMVQQKAGQAIEVGVMRGDKKVVLKVTPQ